ncbi:MAG: DUF4190 domain-containing protein [Pyrinomonadaceae bacterium]
MKKCPTCEKTFDDHLKFCQADGTPLVEDKPPVDPYATMVGNQADFQIPPKEEEAAEAATPVQESAETGDESGDVLEVPEDDVDLMKTMVAGKETSGSIKVDQPGEDLNLESDELKSESAPPVPEPPKFAEPEVSPPEFTGVLEKPEENEPVESSEAKDVPPPGPFTPPASETPPAANEGSGDLVDKPSIPIPSPFDMSMPPGYAPPSTPPFDPSEPVKPVKSEKPAASPAQFDEPKADSAQPDAWSPPPAPVEEWKGQEMGENTPFDTPPAGAAGTNQTLAIVSLILGVLSLICGFGFLTGIPAIITGYMARNKVKESPGEYGGGVLALVGMILGVLGTVIITAISILYVILVVMAS